MLKKINDKRNYIILTIILILLVSITIKNNTPKNYTKEFNYFDEKIIINIYKIKNSKKVYNNIDNIYAKYHKFYLNQDKNNNKEFIKILKYGKKLYQESNGLIDITTRKLVQNIESEKNMNFKTSINSLNFKNKNTLININIDSIIGPYATNEVVKYLKNNKINNYLINEDGNIIAGKHYNNKKYKISIIDKNKKIVETVKLENEALAVKGNTNLLKPYMINPITSKKTKSNDLIVVIDKDIKRANETASILYLIEDRKKYIEENDIKALWQENDKINISKGFQKYTK